MMLLIFKVINFYVFCKTSYIVPYRSLLTGKKLIQKLNVVSSCNKNIDFWKEEVPILILPPNYVAIFKVALLSYSETGQFGMAISVIFL
jgi:hypothetical protein